MPDGTPTWSSSPHATPWFTEVEGTWRVEPAQPRRGEFGVLRAAHVRLYIVDLGGGLPISHHFNAELGAEISTSQVQVTRVQEVAYTRASGGRLTTRLRRCEVCPPLRRPQRSTWRRLPLLRRPLSPPPPVGPSGEKRPHDALFACCDWCTRCDRHEQARPFAESALTPSVRCHEHAGACACMRLRTWTF